MFMTPVIEDTPAGRKMDLWVAQEVFGFTKAPTEIDWIPDYSTNIASAWPIVEFFRRGWKGHDTTNIRIDIYDNVFPTANCYVAIVAIDIPNVCAWADTVPLAICRAALMVAERCKEDE